MTTNSGRFLASTQNTEVTSKPTLSSLRYSIGPKSRISFFREQMQQQPRIMKMMVRQRKPLLSERMRIMQEIRSNENYRRFQMWLILAMLQYRRENRVQRRQSSTREMDRPRQKFRKQTVSVIVRACQLRNVTIEKNNRGYMQVLQKNYRNRQMGFFSTLIIVDIHFLDLSFLHFPLNSMTSLNTIDIPHTNIPTNSVVPALIILASLLKITKLPGDVSKYPLGINSHSALPNIQYENLRLYRQGSMTSYGSLQVRPRKAMVCRQKTVWLCLKPRMQMMREMRTTKTVRKIQKIVQDLSLMLICYCEQMRSLRRYTVSYCAKKYPQLLSTTQDPASSLLVGLNTNKQCMPIITSLNSLSGLAILTCSTSGDSSAACFCDTVVSSSISESMVSVSTIFSRKMSTSLMSLYCEMFMPCSLMFMKMPLLPWAQMKSLEFMACLQLWLVRQQLSEELHCRQQLNYLHWMQPGIVHLRHQDMLLLYRPIGQTHFRPSQLGTQGDLHFLQVLVYSSHFSGQQYSPTGDISKNPGRHSQSVPGSISLFSPARHSVQFNSHPPKLNSQPLQLGGHCTHILPNRYHPSPHTQTTELPFAIILFTQSQLFVWMFRQRNEANGHYVQPYQLQLEQFQLQQQGCFVPSQLWLGRHGHIDYGEFMRVGIRMRQETQVTLLVVSLREHQSHYTGQSVQFPAASRYFCNGHLQTFSTFSIFLSLQTHQLYLPSKCISSLQLVHPKALQVLQFRQKTQLPEKQQYRGSQTVHTLSLSVEFWKHGH